MILDCFGFDVWNELPTGYEARTATGSLMLDVGTRLAADFLNALPDTVRAAHSTA